MQRVMNAAAGRRHSRRQTPVSGFLRDRLHWLRVPEQASQVEALSFGHQSCSWHRTELPE